MAGIKETKELFLGAFVLTIFILDRLKDGAGADDLAALYSKMVADEVFKEKVIEGFKGMKDVPVEIKDLQIEEMIALSLELAPEIIAILGKLPKESVDKMTSILSAIDVTKLIPKKESGAN